MHTFEYAVEIAAPIEHVFEFDSNPENWQRTMPSLRDIEIVEQTDDTVEPRATQSMLGMSMDLEMVRTIVEPNEHVVTTFEGNGVSGEINNRFTETATGTRLETHVTSEFGSSVFDRVIEPIAVRYNNRMTRNHLDHTKELVEAEVELEADPAAPSA